MKTFFVYYFKRGSHFAFMSTDTMTIREFSRNYELIDFVKGECADDVFRIMQGENWVNEENEEEVRNFLKILDVQHTSMSVGDIVYDVEVGDFFMVDNFGWVKLRIEGLTD